MEYIPGPGAPIFIEPFRTWLLRDLQDQREQVVVSIDCSYLEFRLQRTDPNLPNLDVHLPAGVLHLMGWSPSTPLALTSGNGFDPSAPEDLLTIRRVSPEESNLAWDGAKFIASPSPTWLDRYFPGLHDNTAELPPQDPPPTPTDPERDPDAPDLVRFPSQPPSEPDHPLDDEDRDTFCVHYRDFQLEPDSLSLHDPREISRLGMTGHQTDSRESADRRRRGPAGPSRQPGPRESRAEINNNELTEST